MIEGYAREAGVRNLEKQLGRVARKAVVKILGGMATPIKIGVKEIEAYLDKPVFTREKPMSGVGVVTGLAWTAMGGATLPVEASRVHTLNRGFKLTGKLGEVMKESAEIAYSYVASHLKQYGARQHLLRQELCSPARTGRRHPQGRPQRRRHHGDRAAVSGEKRQNQPPPGDDGRAHA